MNMACKNRKRALEFSRCDEIVRTAPRILTTEDKVEKSASCPRIVSTKQTNCYDLCGVISVTPRGEGKLVESSRALESMALQPVSGIHSPPNRNHSFQFPFPS